MITIEQKGPWFVWRNGNVDIIADEPQACGGCGRMTVFFESRHGRIVCTGCEGSKHESA